MGAGTSMAFNVSLDSKKRAQLAQNWQKQFLKVTAKAKCPKSAPAAARTAWAAVLADLTRDGGYVPFVDDQMWRSVIAAYVNAETGSRLASSRAQVQKFITATCFHLKFCEGKSRTEAEKVLRHTAAVGRLVRRIAQQPAFWKGADVFYFGLKKLCLDYGERLEDWLESEVYGGDAMSEERLLGLAHNQFDLPKAGVGHSPPARHTDVLPPLPLDKRTLKPFKNDYRFIVPQHMLALCVRPELERALATFCKAHGCHFKLRRCFTMEEQVTRLLTHYFEEPSPRAAANTEVLKAVVHSAGAGDIKDLMAKAAAFFGPFLQIDNEFETSTIMEDKWGLRYIKSCVAFSPRHPQHAIGHAYTWGEILQRPTSKRVLAEFEAKHSTHPYYEKTRQIPEMDRQMQIWTPLGKDWLRSPAFAASAAQFLVRLDFTPTAYVHAQDQAAFPTAISSTNNVQDMAARLHHSGDLF